MERALSRRRQRGAALFIVVVLFLILLPLGLMSIFERSLQNNRFAQSALWRSQARDAANQTMVQLRSAVANSIGTNGLLEYQANPPAWFVNQASNVNPVSVGFWQKCADAHLCQQSQVQLNNGMGRQTFTVRKLVLPTGVLDPTLCNAQDNVAVFYTLWVQAVASGNPSADAEASTIQSVYRACVIQR